MKQTLNQLKEILNSLTPKQLEQQVKFMGVDEPGFDLYCETLTEPLLFTDDGLMPPWEEMTEEEKEYCYVVHPIGTVFFWKAYEIADTTGLVMPAGIWEEPKQETSFEDPFSFNDLH